MMTINGDVVFGDNIFTSTLYVPSDQIHLVIVAGPYSVTICEPTLDTGDIFVILLSLQLFGLLLFDNAKDVDMDFFRVNFDLTTISGLLIDFRLGLFRRSNLNSNSVVFRYSSVSLSPFNLLFEIIIERLKRLLVKASEI